MGILLRTRNLSIFSSSGKSRKKAIPILENINLDIEESRVTALTGRSGSGKTILAKAISALLPDDVFIAKGTIFFSNKSVCYEALKKYRGKYIFYTPQDATAALNPIRKIKAQISEVSEQKVPQSELLEILSSLNFANPRKILNAYPFQLSGGENQRCILAMAILIEPKILILDEPTAALDYSTRDRFLAILKELQQRHGLTVLMITHDPFIAHNFAESVITLPFD